MSWGERELKRVNEPNPALVLEAVKLRQHMHTDHGQYLDGMSLNQLADYHQYAHNAPYQPTLNHSHEPPWDLLGMSDA